MGFDVKEDWPILAAAGLGVFALVKMSQSGGGGGTGDSYQLVQAAADPLAAQQLADRAANDQSMWAAFNGLTTAAAQIQGEEIAAEVQSEQIKSAQALGSLSLSRQFQLGEDTLNEQSNIAGQQLHEQQQSSLWSGITHMLSGLVPGIGSGLGKLIGGGGAASAGATNALSSAPAVWA